MSQPVTLYSPDGKRTREIAAIDAPGWIKAGWSKTLALMPTPEEPVAPATEPIQIKATKRNDVPRNAVPEN